LSWSAIVRAMLLDDACHSIDSPNLGSILEKVKFPNSARIPWNPISMLLQGDTPGGGYHEPPYQFLRGCK
jgi:hypothetical protein